MLFVQQAKARKSGICHCKQHVIPYNKCLPSQFLADGCYHLIANGLCDPGDEGMPCFQQWFCLPSWVFPVFLWVGHWLLPGVCLICSLILCKTFPDSLLDFIFFIQTFPQDFDLLMEKDEGKFYRNFPCKWWQNISSVWIRLQAAREGLLLFTALCLRSEFKQGSVCFPARKPFSNVEVVSECLSV